MEMLLVDDDKLFTLMAKTMVTKTGLHSSPKTFENGFSALEYLKNNYTPQEKYLIFLDINMPIMNGWEFLEGINNVGGSSDNIFVVMVSSSVDYADIQRALTHPYVREYLIKPLSIQNMTDLKKNHLLVPLFE